MKGEDENWGKIFANHISQGDVYIHYINNSQNSIVIKQPIKKLKKYLGISPKNMHMDSKYAAKKMLSVISH